MIIKSCSVNGCDKPHLARGFCSKHYLRFRRHGDANHTKIKMSEKGACIKWMRDVAMNHENDECLKYPFALAKGYGQLWCDGVKTSAHRWICEQVNGPQPQGQYAAAHECGNSWCVNPRHLKWKTYSENEADKYAHGTRAFGENSPNAILTEDDVRKIRKSHGTHQSIADRFGVSRRLIGSIKDRTLWKQLP